MKFVHCADVHLDSPLRGLDSYDGAPVEQLRGATRRAFENLIDLCIEEKVSFLLLAGDLYDGDWPDFNTGLYFAKQMARLDAAAIRVALIRGNHDATSRITKRLQHPGNVHCFGDRKPETHLWEDLQVAVHGQSFGSSDMTDNLAVNFPNPVKGWLNLGLLHTALDGREGHDPYAPCSIAQLMARGYDYWALGHVHKCEILAEDPWIVFSGCLQGRHIRELGPKGCYLVSVEDHKVQTVEFRELDVLRWARVNVDVSGVERPEQILAIVSAEFERAKRVATGRLLAIRVGISGQTSLHEALTREPEAYTQQIRAVGIEAGRGDIWIERVVLGTSPQVSEENQRARDDGIGELLRAIEDVLGDELVLADIQSHMAHLIDKLPAEVRSAGELADSGDNHHVRALVARAQSLLLARLANEEERS